MKTEINKKPGAIIHCRVSSSKQSQEGESLDAQINMCTSHISNRGWEIVHKPWRESFSGRKESRPVFQDILNFLDKNPGKVQYYVFRSIDRLTRGGSGVYTDIKKELSKRGVQLVDSFGVIQPSINMLEDLGFEYDWSSYSPSQIAETAIADSANGDAKNIIIKLISQEIRLTQRGYKIRQSQDGYKNEKKYVDGKKRTIQVPDLERSKYYIEMFNLRASSQHTDKEIVEQINAIGFRTKLCKRWDKSHENIIGEMGGVLLTVKHLQAIIKRPIYCGVVLEKWTKYQPIKAQYDGLVSVDIFNKANRGKIFIKENPDDSLEVLFDHNPNKLTFKRNKYNPDFPYKTSVVCDICEKPFCGSKSKSKSGRGVPYYHCSRKHPYIGIPKKTFDDAFEKFINGLELNPKMLTSLREVCVDRYRERQGEVMQAASDMGHSVADLEAQKAQSLKAFKLATSEIMRIELEREVEDLDKQIKGSQAHRNSLEITESDIDKFIRRAKYIMEHPQELLLNPVNIMQQQMLFGLVFEKTPTYEEIVNGTPKLTWVFNVSPTFYNKNSYNVLPVGIEPTSKP